MSKMQRLSLPRRRAGKGDLSLTGFTLMELLVAVSIFVFLSLLLVGLLRVSFDMWEKGETRGDIYDRTQLVLDQLRIDLSAVYAQKKSRVILKSRYGTVPVTEAVVFPEASFYADFDTRGNYGLYLVRAGEGDLYRPNGNIYVHNLMRVIYRVNNESGKSSLVRTVFDSAPALTIWGGDSGSRGIFSAARTGGVADSTVFEGVVYFGLKLWRNQKEIVARWDSRPAGVTPPQSDTDLVPEQFLPCAVEVDLMFKPLFQTAKKVKLMNDVTVEASVLKVSGTRELPDPPAYIRVDDEWMMYEKKDLYTLRIARRGARQTAASEHEKNTEIEFGQSIPTTFYFPGAWGQ